MTTATEMWRPVVGHKGIYEVSDQGRVRSVERRVGARRLKGRILRYKLNSGRRQVSLSSGGVVRHRLVHHLVLTAFVGPRPLGLEGCHNNGDCLDNRAVNLRWDTHAENVRDTVRHGTHVHTRRTHCPRNHPLLAPNLVACKAREGARVCLACSRARSSMRKAIKRGSLYDLKYESDVHYERIIREPA